MSQQSPFKPYPTTRGPAKIFLYGDPGTMKTRRAMAMPKPLAIIDMEGGACDYQDLAKDGDMYLSTRSVAELEKALAWVEANADQVGTLIVDPITVVWQQLQQGHIARALKRGTIRRGGNNVAITDPEEVTFEIGDWTKLKTHHGAILTRLLNLPCHVVMIARGMDKTDEKGNVKGYGWDGEKNLAFLAKIVIETRIKGDTVIKDRFTNKFKDGQKLDRVDLRIFTEASGKGGVRLQREDEAADADAAGEAPPQQGQQHQQPQPKKTGSQPAKKEIPTLEAVWKEAKSAVERGWDRAAVAAVLREHKAQFGKDGITTQAEDQREATIMALRCHPSWREKKEEWCAWVDEQGMDPLMLAKALMANGKQPPQFLDEENRQKLAGQLTSDLKFRAKLVTWIEKQAAPK